MKRPQDSPTAPTRRSSPRLLAFAVAAIVLGLGAGVGLVELAMRLLDIRPQRYDAPKYLVLEEDGWKDYGNLWGSGRIKRTSAFESLGVRMGEYVPGATFKIVYADNPRGYFNPDGGVINHINLLGTRGPNVTIRKPPRTYRILGLGDSFTFGVGVRDEDTFLRRLERSLNQSTQRELNYEIINTGVQGYNTRDEVTVLEHHWLKLEPDMIVIVFYINDAYDDSAILNNGEATGARLAQPPGLARASFLYDYMQHVYHAMQASKQVENFYLSHYFKDPKSFFETTGNQRGVDWHTSRAALQRARQLADERNIPLVLVMFPELYNLRGDYPFIAVHEMVMSACRELNIPALDLLDDFRGRDERELWAHPSDHHPNEIAHDIAAKSIKRFLTERVLVGDPHKRASSAGDAR